MVKVGDKCLIKKEGKYYNCIFKIVVLASRNDQIVGGYVGDDYRLFNTKDLLIITNTPLWRALNE